MTNCTAILEVYSLQEILELSDLTEEDVLLILVEEGHIKLPNIKALELDD